MGVLQLAGLEVEFTAHLGAPGGGERSDGGPTTRIFDLNPPRLESLASFRASIFFTRLLRPADSNRYSITYSRRCMINREKAKYSS